MKRKAGDEKEKRGLVFYIQPLDADTNRCIAEMKKSFEKHFHQKKVRDGGFRYVWECEYEDVVALLRSKKTLNLKFKIWLLSSDRRFLDRDGEFFFKNLSKKKVIEEETSKKILKIKSAIK